MGVDVPQRKVSQTFGMRQKAGKVLQAGKVGMFHLEELKEWQGQYILYGLSESWRHQVPFQALKLYPRQIFEHTQHEGQ
jgi:hypothetical protein